MLAGLRSGKQRHAICRHVSCFLEQFVASQICRCCFILLLRGHHALTSSLRVPLMTAVRQCVQYVPRHARQRRRPRAASVRSLRPDLLSARVLKRSPDPDGTRRGTVSRSGRRPTGHGWCRTHTSSLPLLAIFGYFLKCCLWLQEGTGGGACDYTYTQQTCMAMTSKAHTSNGGSHEFQTQFQYHDQTVTTCQALCDGEELCAGFTFGTDRSCTPSVPKQSTSR